ncbi:MAG: T9SS type A sorting domain-containing protein [Flavobacteriales bacterium]|nr:T9SS type A sorting domain-containing protein [Flavobacteriales bacterium]
MLRIFIVFVIVFFGTGGMAQPINILVSNANKPEEPTICIDPKDPMRVVAAANINNLYLSKDGGVSWSYQKATSTLGVWGDPTIVSDQEGNFYYFHLSNPANGSWIDRIVCQKSTDGGETWSDGVGIGKNGTKAQDKQWAVVDDDGNIYLTWTQFDKYGSRNPMDSTIIRFSKSTDKGETWSTPLRLSEKAGNCIDSSLTTEGAVPTIGPNGEVYVSWAGPAGLTFDKSLDGGTTWLPNDIMIDSLKAGWNYQVPGINRCNGLPVTTCDRSGGVHNGTIYVNWSDQRNGLDNTDIWLAKSVDGGQNWSPPIRVNDDTSKRHQFLTWMTVDQSTGYLYFVFYDRRRTQGIETEVFGALSKDGGETFQNFIISESPFVPNDSEFFGDYTNISAVNGKVMPIWARLDNKKLSIWTADLFSTLGQSEPVNEVEGVVAFPNPASGWTNVRFKVKNEELVSYRILSSDGKELLNYPADTFVKGSHEIRIPLDVFDAPGRYICELHIGSKIINKKIIVRD